MKIKQLILATSTLICLLILLAMCKQPQTTASQTAESPFITYELNLQKKEMHFYWKDANDQPFKTIQKVKEAVEANGKTLEFAMNGGMFLKDYSPQGLFVQQGKTWVKLDTSAGENNFYMKPNGVFYTTQAKKAFVCKTEDFPNKDSILYATQSGPMLLIEGEIHPKFTKGSKNVHIRNGVGILPNGNILFAMSKSKVNFYDFANYFKQAGCRNALYLDGFVSRTYLPEQNWIQTEGEVGIIIGVTK
jgi:uncharacterized protein YigE (DUF2233 family)